MSYEDAFKELEQIVNKIEKGNLPMSEALDLFSRGEDLAKICFKQLDVAKGKLKVIKEELGKLVETDE